MCELPGEDLHAVSYGIGKKTHTAAQLMINLNTLIALLKQVWLQPIHTDPSAQLVERGDQLSILVLHDRLVP